MFGLGLALSSVTTFSSPAAGAGLVMLPGQVPAVVSKLQALGSLPATTNLDLAIGLPLRNQAALTNLLQQIYDPASPNYHHYLTPDEFTAQFGPTEQDYQAVIDFAKANGLTVTVTHPNRMVLDVRGKAADIEKALHVALRTYKHPTEARDFFAPDVEPSVPSGLSIQDISGLDNYRRPHPNYKFKPATQPSSVTAKATPNAGSGPSGNYIGNDFRNAYVPGTSLNGSGQTIALVQFDGYYSSDIVAYENLAGRTNIPLQNVLIDGFSGAPTGNGGEVEVSLDIEMVVSMAPALANVVVYEGDPYNFHPNDVLNRIATDNSARQVSCSWGWTGGPNLTTDQIFQQMAIQGQTFFTASGDSDAYPAGTVDDPDGFGTPADSAYLTSVGGTTLTMNGVGGSWSSETVWNWGLVYSGYDGVGSSGGYSSYYSIPAWQTNINMTLNQGSTTTRNFPDVALTADNVYVIADDGVDYRGVGGTSCATPLWAGFTALVNQQATNNGLSSAGFINPAIYAIARGTNYAACFHDITTGNNTWSGSPTLFYAVSGYDLCTGLGTPNGTNLINAFTTGTSSNTFTHISPPPPPYGTNLAALNGGNPNGAWELFVQDNVPLDSGIISNGWILTLTMASPVGQAADLALGPPAYSITVAPGSTNVFSITITNCGPSVSSNVIVLDILPTGFTFDSATPPATRSGSQVSWPLGNLTPNTGTQLTLTLTAPNSAANGLVNYASASSDTPDPNPADDSAIVYVTVGAAQPPLLSGRFVSTNGTFQLTVNGQTGQEYIVQASTNLFNWVPVYTNPPPFVSPFTFIDSGASNHPDRFYRVVPGP